MQSTHYNMKSRKIKLNPIIVKSFPTSMEDLKLGDQEKQTLQGGTGTTITLAVTAAAISSPQKEESYKVIRIRYNISTIENGYDDMIAPKKE